jgi:hypothetical protein
MREAMAEIKITVGIEEALGILAVAAGARDSIMRNGRFIRSPSLQSRGLVSASIFTHHAFRPSESPRPATVVPVMLGDAL